MEKFAHVSEKFVIKSVVAALNPYKQALMHFHQVQLDTVCMTDIVLSFLYPELTQDLGPPFSHVR